MRSCVVLVALVVAACEGDPPIPAHDVHVAWTETPGQAVFGAPFSAAFVTTSAAEAEITEVDLASLSPLVVDDVQRHVVSNASHRRETWTLRGRVLDVGEIVVPGPSVAAIWPDGRGREARADDIALDVVSGLDAEDSGDIELPSDVLDVPSRSLEVVSLGIALALIAAWALVRRRVAEIEPVDEEVPDLRARLELLRLCEPATPREWEALGVDLAATVRALVEASPHDTSEELAAQRAGREERVLLDILGTCDGVKFGLDQPTRARRDVAIDAALELLGGAND